jgi:hypothetical protein
MLPFEFELSSYSDAYFFDIGTYLHSIKNDDKMIQAEGVESLSEEELRQACRERGHLGLLSTEEMRQQVCPLGHLILRHAIILDCMVSNNSLSFLLLDFIMLFIHLAIH